MNSSFAPLMSNLSTNFSTGPSGFASIRWVTWCYMSIGFAGTVGSLLVIIVIFTTQALRTPCFQLIGGCGIGSLLVGFHYFCRSFDNVGLALGWFPNHRTSLQCLISQGATGLFGIPFHAMMTFVIALDRLISLAAPIAYRGFGKRYVLLGIFSCAFFGIAQEAAGIAVSPISKSVPCLDFPEALDPTYYHSFATLNLCCSILTVLAYAAMLICFEYRRRKSKENAAASAIMKQQMAVLPTVRLLLILYVASGVAPEVLITIDAFTGTSAIRIAFARVLKVSSSLVEVVSLTVCCKKFRTGMKILFGWDKNIVVTMVPSAHRVTGNE